MDNYKLAIERSKIRRLPWKKILGCAMGEYIQKTNFINGEDLVVNILMKCRRPENQQYLDGWKWEDIVKNVEIGVSARRAESKIYGGKK